MIRIAIAVALVKILIAILRFFGLGGTSLPGKVALFLHPQLFETLTKDIDIIMVTGTNGKTTTTRIISNMLDKSGIPYISNKSGSNLLNGIAGILAENSTLSGVLSAKTALLELDEGAFSHACRHMQPKYVIVTNFFRDQLDRYGELHSTLNAVRKGLDIADSKDCFKTTLVLNADDSLSASLAKNRKGKVIYYGVTCQESQEQNSDDNINADAVHCIYCKEKYIYSYKTYSHLGGFSCPGCGYSRPIPDVNCTEIKHCSTNESIIKIVISDLISSSGEQTANNNPGNLSDNFNCPDNNMIDNNYIMDNIKIALPGLYNVYNALSAIAFAKAAGLNDSAIIDAVSSFESGFGRMETISAGGRFLRLILVKNPAGFNQVLKYLRPVKENICMALIQNDNIADGRDISWIWDVDFESFYNAPGKPGIILVSGKRAEDMAVRLKYAGFNEEIIVVEHNYNALLNHMAQNAPEGSYMYILPSYTAMLEIRKVISRRYAIRNIWE